MKKKRNNSIIIIIFILLLIVTIFYLFNKTKMPELYKDPKYCDEKIGCDFYYINNNIFCGNTYHAKSNLAKSSDIKCVCDKQSNECIIQPLTGI